VYEKISENLQPSSTDKSDEIVYHWHDSDQVQKKSDTRTKGDYGFRQGISGFMALQMSTNLGSDSSVM
jgi:hypothetical protein